MLTFTVVNFIFLFKVCSIKIESFAYGKREDLRFGWHSPGVEFAKIIEIPHFKLEGKTNLRLSQIISGAILKLKFL